MESIERVMVVDSIGRGQALAQKLAGEGLEVIVSPGNPGNESFAESTGVLPTDISGQVKAAKHYKADLTVVGMDDPLALGIVDTFQENGLKIFGPTRQQAEVEWSKQKGKEIAEKRDVPMGAYKSFSDKDEAMVYAAERTFPLYLKDDGLRQGKGVKRCDTLEDFEAAIADLGRFVVEDIVPGPEISHHAFCDGKTQLSIPFVVRDHKTITADPNSAMTGGMGTVGPVPDYSPQEVAWLGKIFAQPVVDELNFRGIVFSGLKGQKGHEKNLEYNARWGDPEIQLFLRMMKSDLLPVLVACVEGTLDQLPPLEWHVSKAGICLVLASEGYPTNTQTGAVIEGLAEAENVPGITLLHSATVRRGHDLVTDGGRTLNIVNMADTFEEAIGGAYIAASKIKFGDKKPVMRKDIGSSLLGKLSA